MRRTRRTKVQESSPERTVEEKSVKFRFKTPEDVQKWLSTRSKTDYTYSRSVSYSERLSQSEASEEEYELPNMSRIASGEVTRLSSFSMTPKKQTVRTRKKSGRKQKTVTTPSVSERYHDDSGVITRSMLRSQSRSSSVIQDMHDYSASSSSMGSQNHQRLTSTPLRSSTIKTRNTSHVIGQQETDTSIRHLWGLDKDTEEIDDISDTDVSTTSRKTGFTTYTVEESSSFVSTITSITTWLMQYTVVSSTVSVFRNHIQPVLVKALWSFCSILYRVITLNLLTDVWLLTTTGNAIRNAISIVVYRVSSNFNNLSLLGGGGSSSNSSVTVSGGVTGQHGGVTTSVDGNNIRYDGRDDVRISPEFDTVTTKSTTVVTTTEENREDGGGGLPLCCIPCLLLLLLLGGSTLYYLCSQGIIPVPFLANTTSNISQDKEFSSISEPITLLLREELDELGETIMSESMVEKDKHDTIVGGMGDCKDCIGRGEVMQLINTAVRQHLEGFQEKFALYSEYQLKEVEKLRTGYERKVIELQNQVNTVNMHSQNSMGQISETMRTLESEISSVRNDMRTFMFIAPMDGRGSNVNIREYTTKNFQKLERDLHNLDIQLTHLTGDLRSLQNTYAEESAEFKSKQTQMFGVLNSEREHQESVTANATKLALLISVLKSNITNLRQDLVLLHNSDIDDKDKIKSVVTLLNSLETQVSSLKGDLRDLKTQSVHYSSKGEATVQNNEIVTLKSAVHSLKEEVSRLQSQFSESVERSDSAHETLIVVQNSASKVTTDVQKVVDEVNSLKVELATVRDEVGQSLLTTDLWTEVAKLQSQLNVLDGTVSLLKEHVEEHHVNGGDSAVSAEVVERLNQIENEVTAFKIDLRKLHHNSNAANPSTGTETTLKSEHILLQINNLENNMTSIKVEIRNLLTQHGKYDSFDEYVQHLDITYSKLQTEVEMLANKIAGLQVELQQYVREVVSGEHEKVSRNTAEEISRFQNYMTKFESELFALRASVDKGVKRQENTTRSESLYRLEMQMKVLQEDIQNIRDFQRPITGQLSMNINNVKKLKSDMGKMEEEILVLKADMVKLQEFETTVLSSDEIDKLRSDFIELNVHVLSVKDELKSLRADSGTDKIQVIDNMNKLQVEITELKMELRKAEVISAEGSESQDSFSGSIVVKSINQLQTDLDMIKINIRNLQLSQNRSSKVEEMNKLQSVLDILRNDVNRLDGRIHKIQSTLEEDDSGLNSVIQKLRNDLNSVASDVTRLQHELKSQQSVEYVDEQFSLIQDDVNDLKAEIDRLRKQSDVPGLRADVEMLKSQNEYESLRADMKVLLAEKRRGDIDRSEVEQDEMDSIKLAISQLKSGTDIAALKLVQDDMVALKVELSDMRHLINRDEQTWQNLQAPFSRLETIEAEITRLSNVHSKISISSIQDDGTLSRIQTEIANLRTEQNELVQMVDIRFAQGQSAESKSHHGGVALSDVIGLEAVLANIKNELSVLSTVTSVDIQKDYQSVANRVSVVETELATLKLDAVSLGSQSADVNIADFGSRLQKIQSDLTSMMIDVDTLSSVRKEKDDVLSDRLSDLETTVAALQLSGAGKVNQHREESTVVSNDGDSVTIMVDGSSVKINKETLFGSASSGSGGGWFAGSDGDKFSTDLKNLKVDVDQLKDEHVTLLKELHKCCRNETFFRLLIRDNIADILNQVMLDDSDSKFAGWLHGQFITKEQYQNDLKDIRVRLQELLAMRSGYFSHNININQTESSRSAFFGGIAGGSGDASEQRIRAMISEALFLYSADKTGMVDYALESAGGSVINTRCSETHKSKTALLSIFGIPLWYAENSPRTAIQPDIQPGNCWAFKGTQGYLVIQLSGVVKPTSFSLEHIPKSLSPNGNIDSAPREFSVWGLDDEFQHEGTHLGSYTYEDEGAPLQFFPVTNPEPGAYPIIELKINSNYGNLEFTCLYRFRVHGVLQKE